MDGVSKEGGVARGGRGRQCACGEASRGVVTGRWGCVVCVRMVSCAAQAVYVDTRGVFGF